jgi:hypothetical protein
MNVELSERDKDTDKHERKKGTNQRIQIQQGVPGEREYKRKKKMGRFRFANENRYWMEGEERRCRMCYEQRETIEHMSNGCSEIREGLGKKRGEILNEDGREMDER